MYVGHPYDHGETLTLDEGAPVGTRRPRVVRAVALRPGAAKPDLAGIQRILDALPHPEELRVIEVDYGSRLPALPDLSRFGGITHAHVAGRRVTDYRAIFGRPGLVSLFLVGWKEPSLAPFGPLSLDYFRAIRGRLRRFDADARGILLQSCGELEAFGDCRVETATLSGCHRLDLASLANVRGLRRLSLIGPKYLRDVEWIAGCGALEQLAITAAPLQKLDLGPLAASGVRRMFLTLPSRALAAFAARTSAYVSNSYVAFAAGVRQAEADWFSE